MIDKIIDIPFLKDSTQHDIIVDFIDAAIWFFIFLVLFQAVQWLLVKRFSKIAEKTKTIMDDVVIEIFKTIRPPFYFFVAFYFAVQTLSNSESIQRWVGRILFVWIIYQIIEAVQIVVTYVLQQKMRGEDNKGYRGAISSVEKFVQIVLWALGGVLILSNFGVNVTSLIAGLGISGIAIAFASQNIVADLFSSFAILLDKPFVVGDFIVVDKHSGIVKKIGVKTTRLKSLQGEEIVIANKELTTARIQNFRKMTERRVTFILGIAPEANRDLLKIVPETVKSTTESIPMTKFGYAHFKSMDKNGYYFEVGYSVKAREYSVYLDTQEQVNHGLVDSIHQSGLMLVSISYGASAPTETK